MRTLIKLIIKYHFLLFFLLLEVIALSLLFNNSYYQKSKFVSFAQRIDGNYHSGVNQLREYFSLKEVNEHLAKENTYLRNKLQACNDYDDSFYFGITDTLTKQQYYYISSKAINNSVNKQHNFILLDKGENYGIYPEMAVVSDLGVVGVVARVSKNFASVISILNTELKISAKIKKNDYFGSLSWDGGDYQYAYLSEIPYHVEVEKGDTIITSGYSAIFPEGELLGFVEDYEARDGNFHNIKVKLSVDFKRVTYVKVIHNLKKDEQQIISNKDD